MLPIKTLIFKEIRKVRKEYEAASDDELNKLFFKHIDSLRLSYTGFINLKNVFTVYSFELPAEFKTRHIMNLSKLTYPYFLNTKRLILFSDEDSVIIKLCGGIDTFLENY